MEKLKDTLKNNQKGFLIAGAVASTAALGYYGIRRYKLSNLKSLQDPNFAEQIVPLYASEAVVREKMLSSLTYDLVMSLTKDPQYYEGRIKIQFAISERATKEELKGLFLDFHGESIFEMVINSTLFSLSEVNFKKHRIYIPTTLLNPNSINTVSIKFQNTYVNNSAGLHRYVDPKDNEVYIYSHLEPFYCNRWFPCFDQPNLRAPLKLTVISPDSKWQVMSNGKRLQTMPLNDVSSISILNEMGVQDFIHSYDEDPHNSALLHIFEETPPVSTYIYGMFAGKFKCFINTDNSEKVQMRIYAAQSKAHLVDSVEMFRITSAGIRFYEDFFGIKFPFQKYDQIFCPELKICAMENVGAVTFSESFLKPPEEISEFQKFRFAYILLHELSHMWFGDLVTMKWWNDVWLKESFADFMSAICISESEDLQNYRHTDLLFVRFLDHALNQDIKSTTHPIQVNVKHTIDAVNAFDDICYEKGASFIKMLSNFIGRDALKAGTKEYFAKFKFQNTEMNDFIDSLQIGVQKLGSNFHLREWAKSWLTKAGVNEIQPLIERDVLNQTFKIHLKQSPSKNGDPIFHEQKLDVGMYYLNAEESVVKNVYIRANELTLNILEGPLEQLPVAVFINANNKGYCRTLFDDASLRFFLANINNVKSEANRAYLWRTLFDQVKMKKLKPLDFLDSFFINFHQEQVELTVIMVLDKVTFMLKNYFNSIQRVEQQQRLFECLLRKIQVTDSFSLKHILASYLLNTATTGDKLDLLLNWLESGHITSELGANIAILTKSLRYEILKHLFKSKKYTKDAKEKFLFREKALDFTDFDVLMEFECKVSMNDPVDKETFWDIFVKNQTLSLQQFRAAVPCFYDIEEEAQCMKFGDKFFDVIEEVFQKHGRDYADAFFVNLAPTFLGRENYLDRYIGILERAIKTENTHFILLLKEEIELLEEIIEIRSLSQYV